VLTHAKTIQLEPKVIHVISLTRVEFKPNTVKNVIYVYVF